MHSLDSSGQGRVLRVESGAVTLAGRRDEGILVVEDHDDTRAVLFELLTGEGYSVLLADDGQEALDLLERGTRPQLIIMDLGLPRISGRDLLTLLQSDADLRVIPTIVITAASKHDVRVVADAVLHKPLDYDRFLETVRRTIAPAV